MIDYAYIRCYVAGSYMQAEMTALAYKFEYISSHPYISYRLIFRNF